MSTVEVPTSRRVVSGKSYNIRRHVLNGKAVGYSIAVPLIVGDALWGKVQSFTITLTDEGMLYTATGNQAQETIVLPAWVTGDTDEGSPFGD